MVGLLLLAVLAAAPAAADDWNKGGGGNWNGGRQWGDAYQPAQTTDFGGAPPAGRGRAEKKEAERYPDEIYQNWRSAKKSGAKDQEKKETDKIGDEPREPRGRRSRPEAESGASNEVSLSDARDNFQGVVESFLAKNSEDGVWTRREAGRTQRLRMADVETGSVRGAGRGLYSGLVAFRDQRGRKVRLLFTVDFSKNLWAVSSVKRPTEGAAHIVK